MSEIGRKNWRPDFDPNHLYFITTKAVDHAHLFQRDMVKRLLLDTLDCMRLRKQLILYVFVIMPNHIHLIVRCPPDNPSRPGCSRQPETGRRASLPLS